jgi:hypothetical protein
MSTEKALLAVLNRIYRAPIALKGDYSRKFTREIAMAASLGLVTTRVIGNTFGNHWRVTGKGLRLINEDT